MEDIQDKTCRVTDDGSSSRRPLNVNAVESEPRRARPERAAKPPIEGDHPNVFEARVEELIYLRPHLHAVSVCGNDDFIVKINIRQRALTAAKSQDCRSTEDCRASTRRPPDQPRT